jgi:glutamate 5-kinase
MPKARKLSARKLWIGFASLVEGSVTVDDGARRALLERGTSLLPAGVVEVRGAFDEESIVEVRATDGTVIARGMVLCDADTLRAIKGRRTADLPRWPEVVHRDDLVVLERAPSGPSRTDPTAGLVVARHHNLSTRRGCGRCHS